MEESKGLSEAISTLREKNAKMLMEEEQKRTSSFQKSMASIAESLKSEIEDTESILSPMAQQVAGNIQQLIQPLAEGQQLSKDESKAVSETIKELVKEIKKSDKVAGKDQEKILEFLERTNETVSKNFSVATQTKEVFEKYGEKAADTAINVTSGLAGLVSGNNPLVMLLTKTLLDNTKQGILATKNFLKERKERKEARELSKKQILETLEVKKETENQVSVIKDQSDDVKESVEISSNLFETLNSIKEDTETLRKSSDVEATKSSEVLKSSEVEATKSSEVLKSESSIESNEAIVSLLKESNDFQKEEANIRLIKDSENLEIQNENVRRQEQLIDAIEGISEPMESDKEESGFGMWGSLLFIAGSFIAGFIDGIRDSFKILKNIFTKTFGKIITKFKDSKLGKFVTELIDNIKGKFTSIVDKFKNSKLGKFIDDLILKVKNIFSKVITKIDDVKKVISNSPLGKFFTKIKSFFTKIGSFIKPLFASADDVGGVVGKLGKFAKGFGSTLGKLVFPITVIMGIFDTVTGFIKGFKEDGIIGGIKGAITGLFDSIIGAPLDLLKSAVSWILGKLGFDEASKTLDSFSFTEVFSNILDSVFGFVTKAVDYVKNMFTNSEGELDILGGIKEAISKLIAAPYDLAKKGISWILGKLGFDEASETLDSFSFEELINDVFDKIFSIFRSIGDWVLEKAKDIPIIGNLIKSEEEKEKEAKRQMTLGKEMTTAEILNKEKSTGFLGAGIDTAKNKKIENIKSIESEITETKAEFNSSTSLDRKEALAKKIRSLSADYSNIVKTLAENGDISQEATQQLFGKANAISVEANMLSKEVLKTKRINEAQQTETFGKTANSAKMQEENVALETEVQVAATKKAVSGAVGAAVNVVSTASNNNNISNVSYAARPRHGLAVGE